MSEERFRCLHCNKELNPTATFMEMVAANKRNVQKIQSENKMLLSEMEKKFAGIRANLERDIKRIEGEVLKEKKVNSLLITDYEKKISEMKKIPVEEPAKEPKLEEKCKDLEKKVEELTKKNEELEKISEKVDELAKSEAKLSEKMKGIKEEYDTKITTLQDQVAFQVSENKKLIEQIEKKEEEISSLQVEIDALKIAHKPEASGASEDLSEPTDVSEKEATLEMEIRKVEVRLREEMSKKLEEERTKIAEEYREITDGACVYQRKGCFRPSAPMDAHFIKQNIDKLTIDHLNNGHNGIALFVSDIMKLNDVKANYVCVDMLQKKFKYVDSSSKWVNDDVKGSYLRSILYKPIIAKGTEIIEKLGAEEERNEALIGTISENLHKMKKDIKDYHESVIQFLAPLISSN